MNLLVCSVGRRVQLIDCFREELVAVGGKVIAIDCDSTAPALYHADSYEIVPRIDSPDYIKTLKYLCGKYDIRGILSLIDPELELLASIKDDFKKGGIQVIIPDKAVVDICFDKYMTHTFLLDHGLPTIPSYVDKRLIIKDIHAQKVVFPLIVKPVNGSGSNDIHKVTNMKELDSFLVNGHDYIVQPFIEGNEYCVECYIDLLTKQTINMFAKRKINMRAGETDKSIAIKDAELNDLVESLLHVLKPEGPIDIDFFKTDQGYVISEINPRFGGGYPYAHKMGQNFIKNIINNLKGVPNTPYLKYVGKYEEGKTMVRYDHFIVL